MGTDAAIVNTTTGIALIWIVKTVLVTARLHLTRRLHLSGIASVRGTLSLYTPASA
jgi:hypothetical protein